MTLVCKCNSCGSHTAEEKSKAIVNGATRWKMHCTSCNSIYYTTLDPWKSGAKHNYNLQDDWAPPKPRIPLKDVRKAEKGFDDKKAEDYTEEEVKRMWDVLKGMLK